MNRLLISAAKKQSQGSVTVAGFVHNKRVHKGVVFVDLRDLSGLLQLVILESETAAYQAVEGLNLESVLEVSGTLQEKPTKKGAEPGEKDYELLVKDLKVLSSAAEQLPIQVLQKIDNEADLDNRLNWRFLDLRKDEHRLIFSVWTELEKGFRKYFSDNNFFQIYTPTLMSTASETGADVFAVKYFDRQAYLSQSPQFYKQMAMAAGMEKVFIVGPVYRAEKSFTNRHVTEFTGLDFEISYISSHEDIMKTEEEMLAAGFRTLAEKNLPLTVNVPTLPFPRLTLAEVKTKLGAKGIKSEADDDLSPEEERAICALFKEELNHDFVFVTDYPISARPFYHMRHEDNPQLTKSFDLLYQGVEITTGAQREHRVEVLEAQALEKGMNLEELADYLNFFRFGCPPHGGVGIGPARIIMKLLGLGNIKEAIFLPRDVKRLNP
jgi:aspartyl-tRNA synthetase